MTTITYTNEMPYTYDPTHSGSRYFIGGAYKNYGEFCESVVKFHMGLDYMVNPATSYMDGSDIESINASVKSSGASLACVYGADMDSILAEYFANVHSSLWIWVSMNGEEITEYHMNRNEFESFLRNWAGLAKESGSHKLKIRFKKESHKMLRWLDAQVEG